MLNHLSLLDTIVFINGVATAIAVVVAAAVTFVTNKSATGALTFCGLSFAFGLALMAYWLEIMAVLYKFRSGVFNPYVVEQYMKASGAVWLALGGLALLASVWLYCKYDMNNTPAVRQSRDNRATHV